VSYAVNANTGSTSRAGVIQAGDQVFAISQPAAAAACSAGFNSYGATFGSAGGSGQFLFSTSPLSCSPTIGASTELLPLPAWSLANDIYTQPYNVPIFTNLSPYTRKLSINVNGVIYTIKQNSW
jgi:hypothetical protein